MKNIAEILKNCPEGMKLYSPIFGYIEFECVNPSGNIRCSDGIIYRRIFYPDGTYSRGGEVMLFPSKEQRDWKKFLIPFEDGDIIITTDKVRNYPCENIAIFEGYDDNDETRNKMVIYCQFDANGEFIPEKMNVNHENWRKATDEERKEFFDKLHKEGYDFTNDRPVKIVKPKFKVGDTITDGFNQFKITNIDIDYYYGIENPTAYQLPIKWQDKWRIAKFDLESLKPFDRVLVREEGSIWYPTLVSYVLSGGGVYTIDSDNIRYEVIPFEPNKHLIGKSLNPDKYYVTWCSED